MQQSTFIEQHGKIQQRQPEFTAVRLRTIAGNLSSDQLRRAAALADKYGRGHLHITTRQSLEIHWVPTERLEAMLGEAQQQGLLPAVRGPRVLTVIACPGSAVCRRGICDSSRLAAQIDEQLVGSELAAKTKIAVSGCPNACAKPQINDIGLHGVITDAARGYAVYAGGKIGRNPLMGEKIFAVIPEEEAFDYIQAILTVYSRLSVQGERIGDVLNRVGTAGFRQEINQVLPASAVPACPL
ncbi:MAG: hypothetical protein E6X17_00535 [Sporomusaceae bacterium]|nr:hypothetical protein [Sporomusaceae bacterium]